MKLKFMTARQASKDQHRLKVKIEKERNINCRRKGNWRKRKGRKDKDDGKESRETRCLMEGHPWLVAFVYENENNVVSQRLVEKIQYRTMCERSIMRYCYHEILDGHGFILKRSILINIPLFEAWGTWNEVEIYDIKTRL